MAILADIGMFRSSADSILCFGLGYAGCCLPSRWTKVGSTTSRKGNEPGKMSAVGLFQTAGAEEGAGVWLGATEALVENHRLFAATLLKEGATELHVDFRIVQALLLEILKRIFIQDFCPEIAIVACRISAIEYMVEIGSPVARDDFPDQPHVFANLSLEIRHVLTLIAFTKL